MMCGYVLVCLINSIGEIKTLGGEKFWKNSPKLNEKKNDVKKKNFLRFYSVYNWENCF